MPASVGTRPVALATSTTQVAGELPPAPAHRELLAIREIAHALLVADRPEEVHQFALDRVTPLLGAQFSLVMRLSDDGELLRPVAQHEWPARYRAWIGALRVRVGSGPSGLAVAQRQLVEVRNLLSDPDLADWHDVARELGFRSILAAPLIGAGNVIGAVAFYFADETDLTEEQRSLVRLVADQLATTVEKASLIDQLRRTNAALAEANSQLEHLANEAEAARITRDRFVVQVMQAIRGLLDETADGAERARLIADTAMQLVQGDRVQAAGTAGDVEPRAPLLTSVARYRQRFPTTPLLVDEPTVMLPSIRADGERLERLLDLVLGFAVREAASSNASVQTAIEVGRGFVSYRATWPTATDESERHHIELTLARTLARHLGGDMQLERLTGNDRDELTLTLVFPVDMS